MELLTDNHYEKILDLFDGTKKKICIISPFISESLAEKLCQIVEDKGVVCDFITRFYLEDIYAKANSITAIEKMINAGINVYSVRGLHTKLYIFDETVGILGSANFTVGGFKSNIELSVLVDETEILLEVQQYFNNLLEMIKEKEEGTITTAILASAREKYRKLLSEKKENVVYISTYMYGAVLDKKSRFEKADEIKTELDRTTNEMDIVNTMFRNSERRELISYPYTIWLKFDGEGNDRLEAKEGFPMTSVLLNGKSVYLSNYPFKINSIKEGDAIYFAALTTDVRGKNLPVIVGRGILQEFTEDNYYKDEWLKEHGWMNRYPWYTIIKESRIIDSPIENGIPLDELWDKFGSDTYISSFGRDEDMNAVAKKHHQKAHIRLTGNAKEYIDKRLDELIEKYGYVEYISET